jgi:formylglycine-generating enzyme required for sulfatase activity
MVEIPAGEFVVGADDSDPGEAPARVVQLPRQPPRMEEQPGRIGPGFQRRRLSKEYKNQPVVGVSQHDAREFCKRLKKRLPTREEWEAAARGPWGWTFPWGEDETRTQKLVVAVPEGVERWNIPLPRNEDDVSVFGVRDMGGRVYEWTENDAHGASAFNSKPRDFRLTRLLLHPPNAFDWDLGFRCACSGQPIPNGRCKTE